MPQLDSNRPILEDLVANISRLDLVKESQVIQKQTEWARKALRSPQYTRIDQFQVESTLQGLIEKFMVLNREDLSVALSANLQKLKYDKITPDVLFLLIQLSDQPVQVPLYASERKSDPIARPQLTWNQVLQEEPYSDEELWNKPNYSPFTSDSEDDSLPSLQPSSKAVSPTKTTGDGARVPPFDFIDEDLLLALSQQQFWIKTLPAPTDDAHTKDFAIPEKQVIREVLLMLRGLPTSLFHTTDDGNFEFRNKHKIEQITSHVFVDLMFTFTAVAKRIASVRTWANTSQTEILRQAFSASVQKQMQVFDIFIGSLEMSLLSPTSHTSITLTSVLDQVRVQSRPWLFLQTNLRSLSAESGPFSHLEALYELICASQAIGDYPIFELLNRIFVESLQCFLRPIHKWMTEGIADTSTASFFIIEVDGQLDAGSIWNDQFQFRLGEAQEILAPGFIHTAAQRIMDTGKSIRFLNKLGLVLKAPSTDISDLGVEHFCKLDGQLPQIPFPMLFAHAFGDWIESLYSPASAILREQLLTDYRLEQSLAALENIYLSADGSQLQAFADPMFEAIDKQTMPWNDRYVLSERAKTVFVKSPNVNADLISVRYAKTKATSRGVQAVSGIIIDYELSWPALNVIRKQNLSLYQKTFTFLLQLYRAKYLLRNMLFLRGRATVNKLITGLKQRFQWLVDTLLSHFLYAVIKPLGQQLRRDMPVVEDLDTMIKVHDDYISALQAQCLLTTNLVPIHQAVLSILELVIQFSECTNQQIIVRVTSSRRMKNSSVDKSMRSSALQRGSQMIVTPIGTSSGESSDDSNMEAAYEADTETLNPPTSSRSEQLVIMQDELDRVHSFLVAGLQGIGRAGSETSWEMLAAKLDCATKHNFYL